jgi:hypothetical protein
MRARLRAGRRWGLRPQQRRFETLEFALAEDWRFDPTALADAADNVSIAPRSRCRSSSSRERSSA